MRVAIGDVFYNISGKNLKNASIALQTEHFEFQTSGLVLEPDGGMNSSKLFCDIRKFQYKKTPNRQYSTMINDSVSISTIEINQQLPRQ